MKKLGRNQKLSMGQRCGIEHAIHSLRTIFDENEAVLLIDATNAFNLLNSKLALENMKVNCPALFNAVKNSSSSPSPLYVNGTTLWSEECTTRGDPLARCMYGVAILPLIQKISKVNVIHKWYAEDGNAFGRISDVYETFRALKTEGPGYVYFVNAPKCQMIVKTEKMDLTLKTFAGSNVQKTLGTRVLGSVIGTQETCDNFLDGKSAEQEKLLSKLRDIAKTNAQNAHACLTKGVKHKVNFIIRTTPSSSTLLETSEAIIRESIIPALT